MVEKRIESLLTACAFKKMNAPGVMDKHILPPLKRLIKKELASDLIDLQRWQKHLKDTVHLCMQCKCEVLNGGTNAALFDLAGCKHGVPETTRAHFCRPENCSYFVEDKEGKKIEEQLRKAETITTEKEFKEAISLLADILKEYSK